VTITIYHNPQCGTSRNALAMIRNSGVEPQIIDYLQTPPSREVLRDMIAQSGLSVRQALREKGTPFAEFGLGNLSLADDVLLDAMLCSPILINRPFVVTRSGVRRKRNVANSKRMVKKLSVRLDKKLIKSWMCNE
jgi:arsenate reductase (glutaredoxin)